MKFHQVAFILALGFALAGGVKTAVDARKATERNSRVKEINSNIGKGIDAIRALDRHYLDQAKPFTDLADLAPSLRQSNWGGGSCVHATTVSLLRWTGDPHLMQIADEWRRTYSGGEATAQRPHTAKMDHFGLKYVVTNDGDVSFLEWACATRRGCGIAYPAGHCIALIGHESGEAVLLDNNHVNHLDRIPWDEFVRKWKALGGLAFAFVYPPPPPTPH